MSAKPSFGFGDLSDIQPTAAAAVEPVGSIDHAAERLGFPSREAVVRRRRRQSEAPTDQLNIRAAIADINRFVEWCERERLSYREGFAELVARLEDKDAAPDRR